LNLTLAAAIVGSGEKRLLIPQATTGRPLLHRLRYRCRPYGPRDKHLDAILGVTTDLDSQHLGGRHLLVEELDDRCELIRNPVGYEHHPHATGLKIRGDLLPERLRLNPSLQLD